MIDLPTVLKIEEVVQRLRISDDSVRDLIASGRLKCLPRKPRGRILITEQELARFLSRGTRKVRRPVDLSQRARPGVGRRRVMRNQKRR